MALKISLRFVAYLVLFPALAKGQANEATTVDPFAEGAQPAATAPPAVEARHPLRLRFETWEAPALEVAKRLDELHDSAALTKLRAECLAGIPEVSLVLSPVIAIDAPTKVLAESITERIYPTEYEPPALPGSFSGNPPPKEELPKNWKDVVENALTDATPTSFETRNTGLTLEAEVQAVTNAGKSWDVSVSLDDVHFVGTETFGASVLRITMPVFSSFRTTGSIRLKEGQWRLFSVMEPPRGLNGKSSGKRWVTLVRIDTNE